MEKKEGKGSFHTEIPRDAVVAELSEACCSKIRECEHEINRLGYWNIALVAYQMKGPTEE